VRSLYLLLAALIASSTLALSQPRVYILCIEEAEDWWTSKDVLTRHILDLIERSGFEVDVEVVDSVKEWAELVEEGPEDVVLINAHGELMPVPPKYGLDWQSFYRDLAILIMDRGWILVNPVGYGFYYVNYNYTKEDDSYTYTRMTVGDTGLHTLGGWLGVLATAWPPEAGSPHMTDLGRKVFDALGYDMPESGISPRPITTDYPPEWAFYTMTYDNSTAHSCAAFRVGRGMLVWGGLLGGNYELQAKATVAMILYILYPEIAEMPPMHGGFRLTPPQMVILTWLAAMAVMALLILRAMRRR